MTTPEQKRRRWQCPECGRNYRIPLEAETPVRCRVCADRVETGEHPSEPGGGRRASPAWPSAADMAADAPGREAPAPETPLTAAETRRLLEHVENISRTMTLLRRALWVLLLLVLLNGFVFGYAVVRFQREAQSWMGILEDAGPVLGDERGGSAAVRDLIRQIEQLQRAQQEELFRLER